MVNISNKVCLERDCLKKHWAKGYCKYHYYNLYWNKNNRDKINLHQRNHYKRHRKRLIIKSKERYQKKKFTIGYKFAEYRSSARKTRKDFSLTLEEFSFFWGKPCYYCGSSIKTIGLDRLNNKIGYVFTNITPCCLRCNKMKKNMDYEEFVKLCRLISTKQIPFAR